DEVRARLGKGCDQAVDRLHHEVHIDGQLDVGAQRRAYDRADRQVRHVVVVHDVEVNQVRARLRDRAHLLAQAGEIGRQNAGSDAALHGRASLQWRPWRWTSRRWTILTSSR